MNQKTTRFNQDAFVAHDELPGGVSSALSNDITSHGVRTDALQITSYTAGDTSGKPDAGLPEVVEAGTPKRISRKYIPLQSSGVKSQDAVFPQNSDELEFNWRPAGFQNDDFVSVKDIKHVGSVPVEKGGPSKDVMGLLKQLGHSDAVVNESSVSNITNQAIQEKAIIVNLSPTNLTNVEFNQYISTIANDSNTNNYNHYSIQSDAVVNPGSIFTNSTNKSGESPSYTAAGSAEGSIGGESVSILSKALESPITSQNKPHSQNNKNTNYTRNKHEVHSNTTHDTSINSDSKVYEQIRAVLGEGKQDWKRVIKAAKSATNPVSTNATATSNSTVATQENQIEQMIQQVLNQEANSRVELEHVLTHKFSTELISMQQSMNKKIQDLREAFSNFMMR
jgi:hypothetical protein